MTDYLTTLDTGSPIDIAGLTMIDVGQRDSYAIVYLEDEEGIELNQTYEEVMNIWVDWLDHD